MLASVCVCYYITEVRCSWVVTTGSQTQSSYSILKHQVPYETVLLLSIPNAVPCFGHPVDIMLHVNSWQLQQSPQRTAIFNAAYSHLCTRCGALVGIQQ